MRLVILDRKSHFHAPLICLMQPNITHPLQLLGPSIRTSPLLSTSGLGIDNGDDVDWVKPHKVTVKLNESMATPGDWEYSVEEVYDAFGNVVKYAEAYEDLLFLVWIEVPTHVEGIAVLKGVWVGREVAS